MSRVQTEQGLTQIHHIFEVGHVFDSAQTRLILVARAQLSSLNEVARTNGELAAIGMKQQFLAINGLMPVGGEDDPLAIAVIRREQAALAAMPKTLAKLPTPQFVLGSSSSSSDSASLVGFSSSICLIRQL